MPVLPNSIPEIEVNAAVVAYAYETLDMLQAETFIAECAYRRVMASSRPLEVNMTRRRDILERARVMFEALCRDHYPRIRLRYSLPVRYPATSFTPTSFPPSSEAKGSFTRG
jgi:hypothetical protein